MSVMARPQQMPIGVQTRPPRNRLLSLDILRGLTIAGMILVTDPGTYAPGRFAALQHAEWDGATLADMIFPCFLIVTGVSLTLSFSARLGRGESRRQLALHALRRCFWLIVLGLLVNGFPGYDLAHLRLPGILQRIGVCYLLGALLYLPLQREGVRWRTRIGMLGLAIVVLLGGYWAALTLYPTPGYGPGHLDSLRNLPAVLDRAVFTVPHLWAYGLTPGYGVTYDPEGLLSTVPALATVLIGVMAGEVLRSRELRSWKMRSWKLRAWELRSGQPPIRDQRSRQCAVLASAGTLLWLLGLGLSRWLVLNKRIYTPSFALFSDGLCLLLLAGLVWLIDVRGLRRGWTLPLIFGTNAIFAFVLSSVITGTLSAWRTSFAGHSAGLYTFIYHHVYASRGLPLRWSSLLYALTIVLLNAALMYPLYCRKIFPQAVEPRSAFAGCSRGIQPEVRAAPSGAACGGDDMGDTQTQDQTNDVNRKIDGATNDAEGKLTGDRGDAKAEPSGYRGNNSGTAGSGETHVVSATPENATGRLDPSSPGETGTTPGSNAK